MEQIDMDKHVFCITAYKDFQQLSTLLSRLTRGVADAMFILTSVYGYPRILRKHGVVRIMSR